MRAPQILMDDDFRRGLDLTGSWAITRFPPRFSADDGIVSASDRGLYVRAAGTNARTGEPAFSETSRRTPGEQATVAVGYDRAASTVRWLVTGGYPAILTLSSGSGATCSAVP
jgi:hypothetical protein